MKTLNKYQLWDYCRGMSWPWDYCSTGTAKETARGLQGWVKRGGEYTASRKTCAAVAAEIRRQQSGDYEIRIGSGFGESKLFF